MRTYEVLAAETQWALLLRALPGSRRCGAGWGPLLTIFFPVLLCPSPPPGRRCGQVR